MRSQRIKFEEVSIKATKRWKQNGKQRQQTKKFFQTVNPFNKNPDGSVKSREQIMSELRERREEWLKSA